MTVKTKKDQTQIPEFNHRALVMPDTVDEKNRTVDIIFATDAAIKRRNWKGVFYETLSLDAEHVNMRRLEKGAPLLDNHNRWGSVAVVQLGVVTRAWLEGNKGLATIKFSEKENADIVFKDVVAGIVRNFSVGYVVFTYEHTAREESPDDYRAIDWEPFEISVVPIPADPDSQVRTQTGEMSFRNANIISFSNTNMMAKETANKNGSTPQNGGADDQGEQRNAAPNIVTIPDIAETGTPAVRSISNPESTAINESDMQEIAARSIQAERTRAKEIRAAVNTAMLDESVALDMIERGISVDEARKEVIEKWGEQENAQRSVNGASVTGDSDITKTNTAIGHAIAVRSDPMHEIPEEFKDETRKWRNYSMVEMARNYLRNLGADIDGANNREVCGYALAGRAYHSTSDFPIILGNTINRRLASAYKEVPRTFQPFCRRATLRDFRPVTIARLSELLGALEMIPEGGEYKAASFTEGGETYQLAKFGRIINFTWESMVNDDLNAFSRIPMAIAAKAANKQSDLVWNVLLANPTMGDGIALFHASHGNLAGSGGDIDVTTLAAARAAMRKQKNIGGEDFINVQPSYLLVGPDKELVANQFTSSQFVANDSSTINPKFNTSLDVIVEPRVLGNQWYLSASPGQVDTIEYAFLDGEGELFTEQKQGFDVDGVKIKARMVFATKAIDWRGFYKNAGA